MATIRQKQSTYAITISTFQQHRHFQRTANAELFITTLFHHRDRNRFQLHGFVVMPDHIHVLITPTTDQSTAKCIQYIKGGLLLRGPPTLRGRNLAQWISRAPHSGR